MVKCSVLTLGQQYQLMLADRKKPHLAGKYLAPILVLELTSSKQQLDLLEAQVAELLLVLVQAH